MKQKMTDEEREVMRKMGQRGGLARMAAMTPEERSEYARMNVNKRWTLYRFRKVQREAKAKKLQEALARAGKKAPKQP